MNRNSGTAVSTSFVMTEYVWFTRRSKILFWRRWLIWSGVA
jgi:hypothetical protein